jgi:hypothetical protein
MFFAGKEKKEILLQMSGICITENNLVTTIDITTALH